MFELNMTDKCTDQEEGSTGDTDEALISLSAVGSHFRMHAKKKTDTF